MNRLTRWCLSLLTLPATRGKDLDSSETTIARQEIIRSKPFLRQIYREWYTLLAESLPDVPGPVLEIGSGAGFFQEVLPDLITSDILALPNVQFATDACTELPADNDSLRAIVMVNTFHHLPDCRKFLQECVRCLRSGGTVAMIEPWVTTWSSLIYRNLHHEPFDTRAPQWNFTSSGPVSGANGALPWIIFERDRTIFEQAFPQLRVVRIKPLMPFRYLLSGGVSMRSLAPGCSFGLWQRFEQLLEPAMNHLAMFAHVVVKKAGD